MWSKPDQPGLPACGNESWARHTHPQPFSQHTHLGLCELFLILILAFVCLCSFSHTTAELQAKFGHCNGDQSSTPISTGWSRWGSAVTTQNESRARTRDCYLTSVWKQSVRNWPEGELLTLKSAIQISSRPNNSKFHIMLAFFFFLTPQTTLVLSLDQTVSLHPLTSHWSSAPSVFRFVVREACVWHGAGGTSEKEWEGDRTANRSLCHDAAGDRHEGRGEIAKRIACCNEKNSHCQFKVTNSPFLKDVWARIWPLSSTPPLVNGSLNSHVPCDVAATDNWYNQSQNGNHLFTWEPRDWRRKHTL